MKTKTLRAWMAVAAVVSVPWLAGCDTNAPASAVATNATGSGASTTHQPPPASQVAAPSEEAAALSEKAEPANPAKPVVLPAHLKPSPNLAEVIKIAQAGVDEAVLRSFIVNTRGTFNLGSEEIIYLHDLGVSSDVITAMIEHDRALADAALSSAPTAPSPATSAAVVSSGHTVTSAPPAQAQSPSMEAAAPTYTTPPATQPEAATATEQTPQGAAALYYQELAPYGTWVQVEAYGLCWQPNIVILHAGWQPYFHGGRWIYTDYGWYWLSDYTWGARVFHYGRWFRHPRWGWCWYPDTVWGPAWVSWRYWGDYCGWAPLPPAAVYRPGFGFYYYGSSVGWGFEFGLSWYHYSFVPVRHFCAHRPYRYAVPRHQVTQIYERSTVINNIVIGDNNTIINNGIPRERVETVTGEPIRRVAVRDLSPRERPQVRPERLEREGDSLVVYRPTPPAPAGEATAIPAARAVTRTERPGRGEAEVAPRNSVRTPLRSSPGRTGLVGETPAAPAASLPAPPEARSAPRPERPIRATGEVGAIPERRREARSPEASAPAPVVNAPVRPSVEAGSRSETRSETPVARIPNRAGARPAEPSGDASPAVVTPLAPAESPATRASASNPIRIHSTPARSAETRAESSPNVTVIGRNERPARPAPVIGTRPMATEPAQSAPRTPTPVQPSVAAPARGAVPSSDHGPTSHWQPTRPAAPPTASAPTPAALPPPRMNPPIVARTEPTPRADSPIVVRRPEAPRVAPPSPAVSPQPFTPPARVSPPAPPPSLPRESHPTPVVIPAPSRPSFSPGAPPAPAIQPVRPAAPPPSAPAPVISAPPAAERPSAPAPRSRGRAHEY